MKIPEKDKERLRGQGYTDDDLDQIAAVGRYTTYSLHNDETGVNKRISAAKAMDILGWDTFLSGITRSAFHLVATREGSNGNVVLFDSSKFFQNNTSV